MSRSTSRTDQLIERLLRIPPRTSAPQSAPAPASVRNEAKLRAAVQNVSTSLGSAWHEPIERPAPSARQTPAAAHQGAPQRPAPHPGASPNSNAQNEPNVTLTERQLAAVRSLLQGRRVGVAAAELGVDRHTLLRWRRMPAFQAELRRCHERLCSPRPRA